MHRTAQESVIGDGTIRQEQAAPSTWPVSIPKFPHKKTLCRNPPGRKVRFAHTVGGEEPSKPEPQGSGVQAGEAAELLQRRDGSA